MARIFVSATSRDLKSYRKVVAEWGAANGHMIVVQDEFEVMSDFGTIVNMLRDKLDPCDAVIHLAGPFYGFEPTNRPDGDARRSYTQLEYELGKEQKRQVFRFTARPDSVPDNSITQTDDKAELQLQHRARLMTGDQLYYEFSTHNELRILLDKLAIQETLSKPQNLPLVGSLFKGRDEFLDQLRSVLVNKSTHIAAVTAKQAIHGLGGVGKTRVAVEYAKRYTHEYTALLFITADSGANLNANLAQLCGALVLNLPEQDAKDQEAQIAAALRWLREHAGWFLIVDNVDTPEAATAVEALMQKLDNGHVVITSRLSTWGDAVQALDLDVLKETDAKALLLEYTAGKRKPMPTDEAGALATAKDLGYLPLALEQAGAFIFEDGCSFADYRKLWKGKDDEVLTWHTHIMKYPRSVATTWQTSFDKLGEDGQRLLRILCWLAPDPIPLTMLETLENASKVPSFWTRVLLFLRLRNAIQKLDVDKARRDLARYSFAKWSDATNSAIVVHRLVQEITEYRLPQAEKLGWLTRSLKMVDDFCVGDAHDVRSWKDVYTPARSHIGAITRTADQAGITDPTAPMMNLLATYLYTRSELAEAEPLMRRTLAINETSFGPEHPNVATALINLAQLLLVTNRLAEAEPLMRRALAIAETSFGPDHPYVATALNNLAGLLQATNRLAEAEPLMRRALAIAETSFGSDHPNVATALNNLARLLQDTNRLAEAEPLMRRALAIDETSFGPDHPDVARDLNNLAGLLRDTNRLAEAEPLVRRALGIDEASFGPDHPNVATDLNNLATLLQDTNRLAEAEPLMRRMVVIFVVFQLQTGHPHPHLKAERNYSRLLRELGRSEADIEQALAAMEAEARAKADQA